MPHLHDGSIVVKVGFRDDTEDCGIMETHLSFAKVGHPPLYLRVNLSSRHEEQIPFGNDSKKTKAEAADFTPVRNCL